MSDGMYDAALNLLEDMDFLADDELAELMEDYNEDLDEDLDEDFEEDYEQDYEEDFEDDESEFLPKIGRKFTLYKGCTCRYKDTGAVCTLDKGGKPCSCNNTKGQKCGTWRGE